MSLRHVELPALKIGERIITGVCIHSCLWIIAFDEGLLPKPDMELMTAEDWEHTYHVIGAEEGFVDTDGVFMDREEAYWLAISKGQCEPGNNHDDKYKQLHAPDIL